MRSPTPRSGLIRAGGRRNLAGHDLVVALTELLTGSLDSHLDGRQPDVELLGDLLVGHAVQVAQQERDPQGGRHGVEHSRDAAPFVEALEVLLAARLVEETGRDLHARLLDVDHVLAVPLLVEVQAVVDLDALQPGRELGAPFEALEPEERLDEDLLREVLGVVRRTGQIAAVGEDLRLVALDQHLERSGVARPPAHLLDQLPVLELLEGHS